MKIIPSSLKNAYQSRFEPEGRNVLARIYWSVLVILFAVTTTGAIVYGVQQFMSPLVNENTSEVTVGAPKATLNRADIQTVLGGFDRRSGLFDERRGGPAVRDPS